MKRKLTIVIEFDQTSEHDWIWDRKKWKDFGCELLCLAEGNVLKRLDTFEEGLDILLEKNRDHEIIDYVEDFDWYPNMKICKKEIENGTKI